MTPYEFRRRRILFFIGGTLLGLLCALILRRECIIIPLLVILAILIGCIPALKGPVKAPAPVASIFGPPADKFCQVYPRPFLGLL